jgi:DNA-binding SARP family transcriptional activator
MSEQGRPLPSALLRVWTLGYVVVESREENDTEWRPIASSAWKGSSHPRSLLKLLLCCPQRRAQRSFLVETLWPELDIETGYIYLSNAAYKLRSVFHQHATLLTTFGDHRDSGYQLADQSLLWVDADACETLLAEAERVGRLSVEAVPLLEKALHSFERGSFLQNEEGLWCYSRRARLEQLSSRCRIWLAESYEQEGKVGPAEQQYHTLLEDDPTNEDALRRLMRLHHQQGMTHLALRCYEETRRQAQEAGQKLSPAMDTFAQRLLNEPHHDEVFLGERKPQTPAHSFEDEGRQVIPTITPTSPEDVWPLLENVTSLNTISETLSSFENLTEVSWKLSQGNDLDTAHRVLWAYLPKIVSLALPPSSQQPVAAKIVSQSYLLAASLAGHRNDLTARQNFSEQALLFGNVAQDRNLQIAALRQLAATYDYQERFGHVLQTYQQILPYLSEVSSLLRARIYAGASGIYAQLGYKQEALRFLSLAYENFPSHPEHDPSFLFADCGYFTLVLWDGLTHLELHQPREAASAFERIDGLQMHIQLPERVRDEILNHQATTFTELRDMDRACAYLEAAAKLSLTLGSKRRYRESLNVFTQMIGIWESEKRVKSLGGLFQM